MKRNGGTAKVRFLEPKTDRQKERQRRVLDAIGLKRRNPKISMTKAAKRAGTTMSTIRRYAESVLEIRSGRYDAKPTDRIPRELHILTAQGMQTVVIRNSRDASRIARHHNAIRRAVLTFGGDTADLQPFVNKPLRAGGQTYEFLTDYPQIMRFARAGAVHFLDIYATGPQ